MGCANAQSVLDLGHVQIKTNSMQLSQLDQFINSLDDASMDDFIDIMIDDNEFIDGCGYRGTVSDSAIDWITRNDINV